MRCDVIRAARLRHPEVRLRFTCADQRIAGGGHVRVASRRRAGASPPIARTTRKCRKRSSACRLPSADLGHPRDQAAFALTAGGSAATVDSCCARDSSARRDPGRTMFTSNTDGAAEVAEPSRTELYPVEPAADTALLDDDTPDDAEPEKPEKPPPDPGVPDGPVVRLRQPCAASPARTGEPLLDVNGRRPDAHRKFLVEVRLDEEPKKTLSHWDVCHFSALPKWLQDNDYLINGHRPPLPSFRACALSVFRVHTETGNIWSHLLGSLAFATTGALFLWRHNLPLAEQAVFGAFFFCVFLCFFTSTLYHTMHCHSEHIGKFFSRLDYCGIVSIVAGCFTPWIHFLFWCEPRTKLFYLLLGYALCVVTINLTMWEKFGRPHFRLLRASVFTGLAVSCSLLPGVHFVAVHGLHLAFFELAYGWLLAMSLVALIGVALYALRVPERYFPGRCDILFHSHQFFHLAVIVGAYIHLRCLCVMALYRHSAVGAQCRA
ncbi:hypothetical protein MTO96_013512 [Rhipicephalus appendiculatus]